MVKIVRIVEAKFDSLEECAKTDYFVACRKKEYDKHPADFPVGTVSGYFCGVCGEECVIAPAGQKVLARRTDQPVCIECAGTLAENWRRQA